MMAIDEKYEDKNYAPAIILQFTKIALIDKKLNRVMAEVPKDNPIIKEYENCFFKKFAETENTIILCRSRN
jgi:hypothetical protein